MRKFGDGGKMCEEGMEGRRKGGQGIEMRDCEYEGGKELEKIRREGGDGGKVCEKGREGG